MPGDSDKYRAGIGIVSSCQTEERVYNVFMKDWPDKLCERVSRKLPIATDFQFKHKNLRNWLPKRAGLKDTSYCCFRLRYESTWYIVAGFTIYGTIHWSRTLLIESMFNWILTDGQRMLCQILISFRRFFHMVRYFIFRQERSDSKYRSKRTNRKETGQRQHTTRIQMRQSSSWTSSNVPMLHLPANCCESNKTR